MTVSLVNEPSRSSVTLSGARSYIVTFALAAIALVMTVPVRAGFLMVLFIPFIFVTLVLNVIAIIRKPERRRLSITRVVVWLVVPMIVGIAHWYWYRASRTDANVAAAAVIRYKAQTGSWPKSLQEAGIADPRFGKRWMLGYLPDAQRPFMVYAATFMMFDSYTYNFEENRWDYSPD